MYSMETIGLSAFSVFFTQSPSFLAHQKTMEQNKGQSNAQTLFQIEKTPSDNHIRDMLDPVEPQAIYPVYDCVYEAFEEQGILDTFRGVDNTRLIALDGTWYFSSQSENVNCENCSTIEHTNGEITRYHSAITPVIVGPGKPYAIPLRPEFIVPQDGDTKQDCEIKAGKRWLDNSRRPPKCGFKIAQGTLGKKIIAAMKRCKTLELRRAAVPRRLPVGQVVAGPVVKLAAERMHLTSLLKMVAYQVESDLFRLVTPHYKRAENEGRTLVQSALASAADIEVSETELQVLVAPLCSRHRTRVLATLCGELNATATTFPGTNLILRYDVAEVRKR